MWLSVVLEAHRLQRIARNFHALAAVTLHYAQINHKQISPKPLEFWWFACTLVIECNVQNNQELNENYGNSRRLAAVTLHKAQIELATYPPETQEFPLSGCNHVVECRT